MVLMYLKTVWFLTIVSILHDNLEVGDMKPSRARGHVCAVYIAGRRNTVGGDINACPTDTRHDCRLSLFLVWKRLYRNSVTKAQH